MGRIARRGPMAVPIADKESKEMFQHLTVGSTVEVCSDEPGFEGAWYTAKILQSKSIFSSNSNRNGKFLVQYQNLVSDNDSSELLTETVDASYIRPVPPPPAVDQTYEVDDVVDAFQRDGWWKGVVVEVDGLKRKRKSIRRYTVVFENPHEQFKFRSRDVRFHLVWIHGKWVQHPKHKEVSKYGEEQSFVKKLGKNPLEQSTPIISTSTSKKQKLSATETEETLPNCSNEFRNETSANLVSPLKSCTTSMFMNSKENTRDSTITLGSTVEVSIDEHEFMGWYEAKVLQVISKSNGNSKFLIQYKTLCVTETVDASFVRPVPPPPAADQSYELDDFVDAFHCDRWWKGYVSQVDVLRNFKREYTVVFENSHEQFKFSSRDLRFHLVWIDGEWVKHPKRKVLLNRTQCEEQSANVSLKGSGTTDNHVEDQPLVKKSRKNPLEKSTPLSLTSTKKKRKRPAPEAKGTHTNCSKNKFRKETSANVVSPDKSGATSNLINSTELTENSAITNCSMLDSGGNLQLAGSDSPNKGKNCQNQQEAGVENKMTERETKLNAQVTVQEVPAADKHGYIAEAWKNLSAGEDKTNEHPAEVINERCVQSESELVRNEDLPFRKSSHLWKQFDSLEVFKLLPQRPHFSPLLDCNEETREGTAIGHMLTFVSMVEKVSKLKIENPTSLFDSYVEALDILEMIGFDVKAVVDRAKELLNLKTNHEQKENFTKQISCKIAESEDRKAKLEQEMNEIDKKMRELEEQRAGKVSEIAKEHSTSKSLQLVVSSLKDSMVNLEHKFKVKAGAPW